MGPAMPFLMVIGSVVSFMGQMSQADAAKKAGQNMNVAKDFEARQLEQRAAQAKAAGQREAHEEERKARLVASRALALGGKSGAGLSDPTIVGILADISGEGAYRAASRVYNRENQAQQMELGAASSRLEGRMAEDTGKAKSSAYMTQAFGGLASSGMSLYDRFGGGGPPSLSDATGWVDAGTPAYSYPDMA